MKLEKTKEAVRHGIGEEWEKEDVRCIEADDDRHVNVITLKVARHISRLPLSRESFFQHRAILTLLAPLTGGSLSPMPLLEAPSMGSKEAVAKPYCVWPTVSNSTISSSK